MSTYCLIKNNDNNLREFNDSTKLTLIKAESFFFAERFNELIHYNLRKHCQLINFITVQQIKLPTFITVSVLRLNHMLRVHFTELGKRNKVSETTKYTK